MSGIIPKGCGKPNVHTFVTYHHKNSEAILVDNTGTQDERIGACGQKQKALIETNECYNLCKACW